MSLAVRLESWKNTLGHESGDMDAIPGLIVVSCVTLSKRINVSGLCFPTHATRWLVLCFLGPEIL